MVSNQEIAEIAEGVYETCRQKYNFTNLAILNEFKIYHKFNSEFYPQLPKDSFTIFLLYEHFYWICNEA